MARVVVVGAGVGGLAVAIRLAARRHKVTVLEQAPVVGGKVGTFTRDGFSFDTGPSLLTLPAVYRDLFLKTGPALEDVVDLVEVDPACHYRFPDGTEIDVPNASRSRVSAAFDKALGGRAGHDWSAFLQRAAAIWEITRQPVLESPLTGGGDLLRLARRSRDMATVAPWQSLRGLGRSYLRDARLRMFLDRYATYAGSDPRGAPAALAVIPYVEQTFGSWYVRGGLRRLADALHERAVLLRADVRTGSDVVEITRNNGKGPVNGVRLATGEPLPADVVVANADAEQVYGRLVAGSDAAAALVRVRRTTPSLSGFVVLLALRGRTAGLRQHTVLFPDDYDAEFDAIFGRRGQPPRPVEDPAVYVSAPDDPSLRPGDDCEAWFVLVNAPRHHNSAMNWDEPGVADSYADHILTVMARRGLDVRDRVLWREIRTPADLERQTRSVGGSIYGTSSNGARAAFLRPANRSPVPGLFLVGGSAHPGGGLPLVGMSAAIVADLIGGT